MFNLKHYRTTDDKKIYIDHTFPPATGEKRRWNREVIRRNHILPKAHQKDMQILKGELKIKNQQFMQPVLTLRPEHILGMNPAQLKTTLQTQVVASNPLSLNKSKFIG